MKLGHNLKRFFIGLMIVCLSTTIGVSINQTPFGKTLEKNLGLSLLFTLRGETDPYNDLVIIAMDRASQQTLSADHQFKHWPRENHADLLDKLNPLKPAAIGFDIFFRDTKDKETDQKFAKSLASTPNVTLFQYLKIDEINSEENIIQLETLINPYSVFMNASASLAPFPLPRDNAKISEAWLFKPELDNLPTMPVVMLHHYFYDIDKALISLIDELINNSHSAHCKKAIQLINEPKQRLSQQLRKCFINNPHLAAQLQKALQSNPRNLSDTAKQKISRFIDIYSGPYSRVLNFYGSKQTIHTISYAKALSLTDSQLISNKAIFIGYSEKGTTEHKDDFTIVYHGDNGNFLSGVEVAATLFSNIIKNDHIKPTSPLTNVVIFFAISILLVTLVYFVPLKYIFVYSLFASAGYISIAEMSFSQFYLWVPTIIPSTIQILVCASFVLLWRYYEGNKDKQRIRQAFSYHLPQHEVDKIINNADLIKSNTEELHGICLATDAGQYTTLAETIKPMELSMLMNSYYNAIFAPVRDSNGYVSDVIGDAMLAIWAQTEPSVETNQSACITALKIKEAAQTFNKITPNFSLPTRIGLHSGDIALGHVGAGDHFEYRAVGDIVNTATRIEGLNKILGTQILASKELVEHSDSIAFRDFGKFILKGKTKPVHIVELVGLKTEISEERIELINDFNQAVHLFNQNKWEIALANFSKTHQRFGDIACELYISICQSQLNSKLSNTNGLYEFENGIIHIKNK